MQERFYPVGHDQFLPFDQDFESQRAQVLFILLKQIKCVGAFLKVCC